MFVSTSAAGFFVLSNDSFLLTRTASSRGKLVEKDVVPFSVSFFFSLTFYPFILKSSVLLTHLMVVYLL